MGFLDELNLAVYNICGRRNNSTRDGLSEKGDKHFQNACGLRLRGGEGEYALIVDVLELRRPFI